MSDPIKRKWTGGEWQVRLFKYDDGSLKTWQVVSKRGQLDDKHDVTVCDVYSGVKPEEAQANAHILAAAPELFEALTTLSNALSRIGNPDLRDAGPINLSEARRMAQVALSAALGESE